MQISIEELQQPKDGRSFDVKSYSIATLTGKVGMFVGDISVTEVFGLVTIEGKPIKGYAKGAGMEIAFLGPSAALPSNVLSPSEERLEATLFLRVDQMATIASQLQSKAARIVINTLGADACAIAS